MTHYLNANQVPAQLKAGYTGQKFEAIPVESMTIPSDAGLWDGGSRTSYRAIDLATGQDIAPTLATFQNSSPWNSARKDIEVKLSPGQAVVAHVMFQGKDLGLRFYVHPSNVNAFAIEETPDLDPVERIVLIATRSFKSSYAGKDRYDMATDDLRWKDPDNVPTREQWETAKASLIDAGMLNKRGAITTKGKNAIG